MKNTLSSFINEILLSEEVFGRQAFVYHGSQLEPEAFLRMFYSGRFDPGKGAGAMYGKGLYTVYDLHGTDTENGEYGPYLYKFKVNLNGFVCFDDDITKKIYGKVISPAEQAKSLGLQKISKFLETTAKNKKNSEYTSDEAHEASIYLNGHVKGIIFTGRQDGKVAVIYDPDVAIITSYKQAHEKEWKLVDRETIKKSKNLQKSSLGTFQKRKYTNNEDDHVAEELRKLSKLQKDKRVYEGNLSISRNSLITRLPDNLVVKGDLDIAARHLQGIGNFTHVEGELTIYESATMTSLPMGLRCEMLSIRDSKIKVIPPDIKLKNLHMPYTDVKTLPDNCYFNNIYAVGSKLEKLPNNFVVHGSISLKRCLELKSLPPGMVVHGDLNIKDSGIEKLPKDLKVHGEIISN